MSSSIIADIHEFASDEEAVAKVSVTASEILVELDSDVDDHLAHKTLEYVLTHCSPTRFTRVVVSKYDDETEQRRVIYPQVPSKSS